MAPAGSYPATRPARGTRYAARARSPACTASRKSRRRAPQPAATTASSKTVRKRMLGSVRTRCVLCETGVYRAARAGSILRSFPSVAVRRLHTKSSWISSRERSKNHLARTYEPWVFDQARASRVSPPRFPGRPIANTVAPIASAAPRAALIPGVSFHTSQPTAIAVSGYSSRSPAMPAWAYTSARASAARSLPN